MKGPKYSTNIEQDDSGWRVDIVRRVSSRKTLVSKSQDGFASEDEAKTWAESELNAFLQSLRERNKRKVR